MIKTPSEYKPLTEKSTSWAYKKAIDYLVGQRKVDMKLIQKYNPSFKRKVKMLQHGEKVKLKLIDF